MFRTKNPVMKPGTFTSQAAVPAVSTGVMTLSGTVGKSLILFALMLATAGVSWSFGAAGALPCLLIGAAGGLITALITAFNPSAAPLTTPLYALLEGLFIGSISYLYEKQFAGGRYSGIVPQAVLLTFGVLAAMLILYRTHIIRVTDTFKMVVFGATLGIAIAYAGTLIASLFWREALNLPIYQASPIGIVFSLFVVVIAALNLAIDFDLIDQGIRGNAPRYMEWYGAFALLVTLVWLYIEILRLLSKIRR